MFIKQNGFLGEMGKQFDDTLKVEIQELLDSGKYFTRREIYHILKDEGKIVYNKEVSFTEYFRKQGFTLSENFYTPHVEHKKKDERLRELSDLVTSQNTNDAVVLAEEMHVSINYLRKLAKKLKIHLTNSTSYFVRKRNPQRDAAIAHEPPYLTLKALAQAEAAAEGRERPVSEGRMYQYMEGTQQYEAWQQRRDAYKRELKQEEYHRLNKETK